MDLVRDSISGSRHKWLCALHWSVHAVCRNGISQHLMTGTVSTQVYTVCWGQGLTLCANDTFGKAQEEVICYLGT